jgi:hypothetical protein
MEFFPVYNSRNHVYKYRVVIDTMNEGTCKIYNSLCGDQDRMERFDNLLFTFVFYKAFVGVCDSDHNCHESRVHGASCVDTKNCSILLQLEKSDLVGDVMCIIICDRVIEVMVDDDVVCFTASRQFGKVASCVITTASAVYDDSVCDLLH